MLNNPIVKYFIGVLTPFIVFAILLFCIEAIGGVMKRRKKKPLKNVFKDEYVEVTLKSSITTSLDGPEGCLTQKIPITIAGYLTAECPIFYYLGDMRNTVNQKIKKKSVEHMMIVIPKSSVDDVLDKMPVPGKNHIN